MTISMNPIGLSKREHFAALILAGITANSAINVDTPFEDLARMAIDQADTLIELLNFSADVMEAQRLTIAEMPKPEGLSRDCDPEDVAMNELRAELYGDEILLGGIDD